MTRKSTKNQKVQRQRVDAAAILRANRLPEFDATVLEEPSLIFGSGQRLVDPKTGLSLHGPFDSRDRGRPTHVRIGLIGTGATIDMTRRWVERCRDKIAPFRKKGRARELVAMDPIAYTPFPGTGEVFDSEFIIEDGLVATLRDKDIAALQGIEYFEPRVTRLIDILIERLRVLSDKPSQPDVVIIALPTAIRDLCTKVTQHKRRPAAAKIRSGSAAADQEDLFADVYKTDVDSAAEPTRTPEVGYEHTTLHHGLKARAMEVGLRTQMLWQATLEGTSVQDEATRAWNFWTALYYKAGGIPWRAAGLAQGTCFVGVGFYKDRHDGGYRTCLAQAFSDEGEGFVLRSDPFKWDQLTSPHLSESVARDLMTRVLSEYEAHLHHAPRRVVVHKWSRYWADEKAGFDSAIEAASVHSSDLISLGSRDIRFFRAGQLPPLRNTLIQLAPGNAILYTQGYTPFSGEYGGMRVPRPLEIIEHHGSASMTQIAQEILTLTKLDFNTTAFSGREPITTAFSEEIGHILAELPPDAVLRTRYWFYM